MEFDEFSNRVIGCAIEVHRELGPGLMESPYEQCLAHELKFNNIRFKLQEAREFVKTIPRQMILDMEPDAEEALAADEKIFE